MRLRCCNKNQECIDFFAQYGTSSNPTSGSLIPLNAIFRRGDEIHLEGDIDRPCTAPGYLYLIDYVFLATPEADGFMEIIPSINGTPRLLYSFFAPTGAERIRPLPQDLRRMRRPQARHGYPSAWIIRLRQGILIYQGQFLSRR